MRCIVWSRWLVGTLWLLSCTESGALALMHIDGVRQAVSIGEIRQVPGARAFRLSFEGDVSPRIAQFARRLALEAGDTPQEPGLVEFDPDVWSGWAAISTVAPSG